MRDFYSLTNRRCIWTRSGYWVNVSFQSRPGDYIFLLAGSKVPYVLRKHDAEPCMLVGDAYVDGVMYGEAWDDDKCETIKLVRLCCCFNVSYQTSSRGNDEARRAG
jgi:hypothetical protein